MSDDLARLGFSVDTSGLSRGERKMKSFASTGERTEKRIDKSSNSMGSSFKALGAVIGGVVTTIASMNKIVSVSREFDVLNSQLITSTGSAENAAIAFNALQNFAAETPYSLSQAVNGFTQLVNLGLTPSEAAMVSYGNTASAMGKDLSQMIEAVADASTGEFERLKEFGIKAKSQGDNVSFTFQGVTTTVKKNAGEIEGYLMKIGNVNFAGAMETRSKTLDGALSNLSDTWDGLFRTISNNGVGSIIKSGVTTASNAIQTLTDYIESGGLSMALDSVFGKFDGYVQDVALAYDTISSIIASSTSTWDDPVYKFLENMRDGLGQLPEMTRFFIQLAAVKVGLFVDYAKIYADQFVDIMALRFSKVVAQAKIDGKMIADAINPFSDDSFNYEAELSSMNSQFMAAEEQLKSASKSKVDALSEVSDQLINDYALQAVASTDASSVMLSNSEKLYQQYLKTKSAQTGDVLSQFGIGSSGSTSSSASTLSTKNSTYSDTGLVSAISEITSSTTIGQIDELNQKIELTKDLLKMGLINDQTGTDYIKTLTEEIKDLSEESDLSGQFDKSTDAINSSLTAMRELTEQGTTGYNTLSTAIAAVTAAQKLAAIASAATMATVTAGLSAAVSLISAISTLGGDLDTTFEATQAIQGLDEWGNQADSISTATEDTADYLDDLVGINTDMLDALVNLQSAIQSASGIAQSDISGTSISYSTDVVDNLFSAITDTALGKIASFAMSGFNLLTFGLTDTVFNWIGSALGGSSKTTDTGIKILGGTLSDMIDGASVYAYEDVKSKKYAWSSSKTKTYTSYLDDASSQFTLVFDSLADSVYEAGSALGFTGEYLTDAINNFVIDTSEISLEDMSSDEITEALEAYFSNVFSDLAESVVYYLDEFQDTGEELGETLTRLATEVTLLEYASENLGVSLGNLTDDSYSLVSAADGLADLLGGTENFSDYLSSFITNFASDSQMLSMYSDTLTESLSDVGLSLPGTSAAMWELMSTLDASADSGLEQIATLLELSDTASEYYDLLEDTQDGMADLSDTFAGAVMDIYNVSDAVNQISLDAALAAAQLGDFSLAEALDTSDYTLDTSDFASLADYNIAQAEVANKLLELSELSAAEAGDVETEQLDELKAINASIIASITETNNLLQNNYRVAVDTNYYLDTINNKTSYAA